MPQAILPEIPQSITVHLGAPDRAARNVTVPFAEYVKNVASSEIYPTWPENALIANINVITSFALNRIFTEYYRSRGYDFDITSSTAIDQAFVEGRDIFENISSLVDERFNDYVVKGDGIEPYFTQFCNGTTSTCAGFSQWGSVDLANAGLTPLEILRNYYGEDINIVYDAPVAQEGESYPGFPLVLGDRGNAVKIVQTELNRISKNYPAIPQIVREDGIFGLDTQAAVRKFQEIFSLTPNGEVDKATWYKIKRYYTGVKSLSDLFSEGITLEETEVPFPQRLAQGDTGAEVRNLQYYLSVMAYFNPSLPELQINGVFDDATVSAVRAFQEYYGLAVTGVVNAGTWGTIKRIYIESVSALPEGYSGNLAKIYPGYFLTEGQSGQNVRDLQTYLSTIGRFYGELPVLPVTGYFGSQTREAVERFQTLFGIEVTGAVGPITWYSIAREYDFLVTTEGATPE